MKKGFFTLTQERMKKHIYLAFILPALLWVLCFTIYPFFYSIYISFTDMQLLKISNYNFVGIENYTSLFRDNKFWISSSNTLVFTTVVILFQFLFGFLLALLLNKTKKFTPIVRTSVMLPWVLPPIALALVWAWIMKSGNLGLINAILINFKIQPISWLGKDYAMKSIIGIAIWIGVPFSFMLELASLQKIDPMLYEAASIDGVNWFQKLWYITIASMKNTFMINLIMITISTIGYFDIIYALTDGGPGSATEVLPLFMYHTAFKSFNLGEGSAIAVVMILLSLIYTFVFYMIFKDRKDT